MKELSVFVDESGDFGEYNERSPFYIISLVFHDQKNDINDNLLVLDEELTALGWPNHCIHAGPIIRSEKEYRGHDLKERQKLLSKIMTFIRQIDINYTSIYIEKKHIENSIDATGKLSKKLAAFIKNNYEYFCRYDIVKIYYDNGQTEVTKILSSVFNALLENVEFRKVKPSDYRLFQVADVICTLKLSELKLDSYVLSKSETYFFKDKRTLKKNYLKPLHIKEL